MRAFNLCSCFETSPSILNTGPSFRTSYDRAVQTHRYSRTVVFSFGVLPGKPSHSRSRQSQYASVGLRRFRRVLGGPLSWPIQGRYEMLSFLRSEHHGSEGMPKISFDQFEKLKLCFATLSELNEKWKCGRVCDIQMSIRSLDPCNWMILGCTWFLLGWITGT